MIINTFNFIVISDDLFGYTSNNLKKIVINQ